MPIPNPTTALHYTIDTSLGAQGQLLVALTVPVDQLVQTKVADGDPTDAAAVELFLPVWTPGSYLVREYARHLSRVVVSDADTNAPLAATKVRKNRFRLLVPATTRTLRVSYRVYAHDLSVRTADATAEHAYWNHACILLWPVGQPDLRATIEVLFPAAWQLACPLPRSSQGRSERGDGRQAVELVANGIDDALDAPCLVGRIQTQSWQTLGVQHEIALEGLGSIEPPATLSADLDRIVKAAANVFGGRLPYPSYLFLCLFAADGYGGLEHSASTTLLLARTELRSEKGYREFLALAAHELFHAWNIKRLRPAEFWSYDYEAENYTSLLWLIEGWTAYYDDLLCVRAGLTTAKDYLGLLAKSINSVLAAPGRLQLSLSESSFDAWLRLYRPDENTRNSSQNYYVNGSIAALVLDLLIRRASAGTRSLDDVLRHLYASTFEQGRGYRLADVEAAVCAVSDASVWKQQLEMVSAEFEPTLAPLLADFGVVVRTIDAGRPLLGVQFENHNTVIGSVTANTPAHLSGLQPGDEILAVQDLRVDHSRWQDVFNAVAAPDQKIELLLARRGVVQRRQVTVGRSPGTLQLELDDQASPSARQLREAWLASAKDAEVKDPQAKATAAAQPT